MGKAQKKGTSQAFRVMDCALASISVARRARDLRQLRDNLHSVEVDCIYYHFWGTLLQPRFENPEYLNDFAEWAHSGLHDAVLAERLGVIDPTDYPTLEELRHELLEVIEQRLDETETPLIARPDRQFQFVRSQIVVFDTRHTVAHPRDMAAALNQMSLGSVFYHFIDARRRLEGHTDDFRAWVGGFGGEMAELVQEIATVTPYFTPLRDLRDLLARAFESHFAEEGHA